MVILYIVVDTYYTCTSGTRLSGIYKVNGVLSGY